MALPANDYISINSFYNDNNIVDNTLRNEVNQLKTEVAALTSRIGEGPDLSTIHNRLEELSGITVSSDGTKKTYNFGSNSIIRADEIYFQKGSENSLENFMMTLSQQQQDTLKKVAEQLTIEKSADNQNIWKVNGKVSAIDLLLGDNSLGDIITWPTGGLGALFRGVSIAGQTYTITNTGLSGNVKWISPIPIGSYAKFSVYVTGSHDRNADVEILPNGTITSKISSGKGKSFEDKPVVAKIIPRNEGNRYSLNTTNTVFDKGTYFIEFEMGYEGYQPWSARVYDLYINPNVSPAT